MKQLHWLVAAPALAAMVSCGGGGGDSGGAVAPQADTIAALDPGFTIKNPNTGGDYILDPGNIAPIGGRPAAGYTFTLANGTSFPPGTTVDHDTGIFHATGAVSTGGSFDLDISDGHQTVTETFTVTASACSNSGVGNCLAMCWGYGLATPFPDGAVGKPFGAAVHIFTGSSGQSCEAALPLSWSLDGSSGPLPPGLSLDAATGVIHGTPTLAGTFGFKVLVVDNNAASPVNAAPAQSITIN